MLNNNLEKIWKSVANDLDITTIAPFSLQLSPNVFIEAEFLLKDFGAKKGMLVFKDFKKIESNVDKLVEMGYGFSILEEPEENIYIREDFIELLKDWGWSGGKNKPAWY